MPKAVTRKFGTICSKIGTALVKTGMDNAKVVELTRAWIEKAVIGLDLCPFARAVYVRDQIRYVVSAATGEAELVADLICELEFLRNVGENQVDTTLLVHPHVLTDFLRFNDFLHRADKLVRKLGLEGHLQLASFHPQYQFAGSEPDDIENFTNRAPFPILHILRESSVERALAHYPDPENIFEKNRETLRQLGRKGWQELIGNS